MIPHAVTHVPPPETRKLLQPGSATPAAAVPTLKATPVYCYLLSFPLPSPISALKEKVLHPRRESQDYFPLSFHGPRFLHKLLARESPSCLSKGYDPLPFPKGWVMLSESRTRLALSYLPVGLQQKSSRTAGCQ